MWQLIRLTLARWRSHQQRIVNGCSETQDGLNVPAQIGSHNLICYGTFGSDPGSGRRPGDVDNAICMPHGSGALIKNEWSMRNVANRDYSPFLGARVGVVCHDGSYQFWEWDGTKVCFVPLARSSLK